MIEASGELFADVWVRQAVIHGRVDGDLYCQEQLVLHPTAEVTGNITVPPGGFVMLDGAKLGVVFALGQSTKLRRARKFYSN